LGLNIVFSKNGVHTLTDYIIIDPNTCKVTSLSKSTREFVALEVAKEKGINYQGQYPMNSFFPK
jgi:hypothetical protein